MALTEQQRKLLEEEARLINQKSDAEKTREDYNKLAKLNNWATADYNGNYTGVALPLGNGNYTWQNVAAGGHDAIRYNYDVQLDPRSNNGAGDAIQSLLGSLSMKAAEDAANGQGDYSTLLQNLYKQVGYTDANGIYDSLQKNKNLGLTTLDGRSIEEAYGLGNPNWVYDPAYDIGSKEWNARIDAQREAEQAYLQALPEYKPGQIYDGSVTAFNRGGQLLDLAGAGNGGNAWNYDLENDPVWQAYKRQYERGGNTAMNDTVAQLAARTGGMASSYAGQAGQQTYDSYMQGLTDVIPTLEQAAYERWMDEQNLQMQQQELELQAQLQRDQARAAAASSGSGSSSSTKPVLTAAQTLEALKDGVVNDQTLSAYRYYYGQDWDGASETSPASASGSSGGSSGSGSVGSTGGVDRMLEIYQQFGGDYLDDFLTLNYKSLGFKSKSEATAAWNIYARENGLMRSSKYETILKEAREKPIGQLAQYLNDAPGGITEDEANEIYSIVYNEYVKGRSTQRASSRGNTNKAVST